MKRIAQRSLAPLIEQFGIQRTYIAANGEKVTSSIESVLAVLDALGADTADDMEAAVQRTEEASWSRALEPVVLAWNGLLRSFRLRASAAAARGRVEYVLTQENGDVVEGTIPPSRRTTMREMTFGRVRRIEFACDVDVRLPIGYHDLTITSADGTFSALVIAAPMRCHGGDRPCEWGVFAPMYSLRRDRNEPIGDFGDIAHLMDWMGELNGDVVATLPMSAAFLHQPFDPSPYAPASRLFWNELYVDTDRFPGAKKLRASAHGNLVDYREVAEAKRALLEDVAAPFFAQHGERSKPFREFLRLYPDAREYARFRAASEHFESGWPGWPAAERAGTLRRKSADERAVQYHLFAQFATHTQLTELAQNSRKAGVRLYLDLPLGVHPDSYDVWRFRDLFVTGASAGAPPDPFFTKGQDWGFPPMNPVRMREDRYEYWRKVLQTQLRYAGILRLDHVMSLHRLYFVPQGMEATEGVYVRYAAEELYAVLAVESARHEAIIVGEDLGTVPAEVRKSMGRHGVKRMFVVQFEASENAEQPLPAVPKSAVASLNTHDMPPFRAYWDGLDADLRHELGLIDNDGVAESRAARKRTVRAVSRLLGHRGPLDAESARRELLRFLAASDADMLLINLEDLWLEVEPQNVPGTSQERPNWRRRLKYTVDEIRADARIRELLQMVAAERRRNG